MKLELKDWLNSINMTKNNIMDENPDSVRQYVPYIINRCLSGELDCLMYVNEMNLNPSIDKKLQYDFLLNSVRKRKRFSPWLRKEEIKDLECVKQYYGYSNEKALQALKILTKQQIDFIKSRLDTGGSK